jgi:hypothetical protein
MGFVLMSYKTYKNKVFDDYFQLMKILHEVIAKDNQYNHLLKDIFTEQHVSFLRDTYLYDITERCLEENLGNINWDHVRNEIVCWWEGVDDFLYHKRLDEGEKI